MSLSLQLMQFPQWPRMFACLQLIPLLVAYLGMPSILILEALASTL
jgi:hypothetical protein